MGVPSEVKEMLKEFGDDPFGNDEELLGDGGWWRAVLRRLCNDERTRVAPGSLISPFCRRQRLCLLAGVQLVFE